MTQESAGTTPVIEANGVSRRFAKNDALCGVSLSIPSGTVFGLVGENGAGKTTFVRHVLGLLKPQSGSMRVFGLDPVKEPAAVLARIGYLSEKRDVPLWMRIGDLMRYTAAFYPDWDHGFAAELLQKFELSAGDRLATLSNGQQARAALTIAVAHRPELLLLDEPSAGLDAVVRRDILGAIIRTVSDEGRTVLFSSHLLDEVERVSDHVAMIHKGRVVMCGPLDDVKQSHRRLLIHFADAPTGAPSFSGTLTCEGAGRDWTVVANCRMAELRAAVEQAGAQIVEEEIPSLEDIFVARVGARCPDTGKEN